MTEFTRADGRALDQMRRTVGIETPLVRLDRSAPLQAPRPLPAMMAC